MGIGKDGYYDLRDILGYQEKYNLILSYRGPGKTWAIKHFLASQPGKFMCIYRQKPDMAHSMKEWHAQLVMSGQFHEGQFEYEGSDTDGWQLLMDGEVKGYFRTLSSVNNVKQEVFPSDLNWVFWDEFIPLSYKKIGGISSEGDALRTIVKTIEHDATKTREQMGLKPVRVILVGNPHTANNPILDYFHVNLMLGPGIHRAGPGVVWELLEVPRKEGEKMTVDDFLGNEVYAANGWEDGLQFIKQPPKGVMATMSVRFGSMYFHVYRGGSQSGMGKWFIRRAEDHKPDVAWWGTIDGLREGETCIEGSYLPDVLKRAMYGGKTYWPDLNTKYAWSNAVLDVS